MRILAIDPGPKQSAWLVYDYDFGNNTIVKCGVDDNERIVKTMKVHGLGKDAFLAVEMISSYGMAVGKTTFETCVWIGRFIEAWQYRQKEYRLIYRYTVKEHLCHSMKAKDTNIRQAIIDLYPATGGGKIPQIGTKKQPGPLYGVKKDIWSALAVAITAAVNHVRELR